MKRLSFIAAAAAFTLVASHGFAQSPQKLSENDKIFATKAATGGMAEVSMGELAQRNAQSPQVKQFGERMVTDHGKANAELKQIAHQQDFTLPTNVDSAHRAVEQRMTALKGGQFDAAYIKDMVQDHQEDIADFQREAQSGQDPALKQFAQQTLPILQQHLKMAQQLASSQQ